VKLIGLSGTNGSGKDTVGLFLAEKYKYLFISGSDMLREECRKRGLEVTRENLRTISAEWRREFGLGVLVDKAVEVFNSSQDMYAGLIVSPMRNVGEAQHIKDLGGTLVWVDADPEIRYQRVVGANRGRDGEDNKTYDEFRAEEQAEMHPSDPNDPAVLNMSGVREIADVQLLNETTLEQFQTDAKTALGL
jgi:dephospho-CoA kinase